MMGLICSEAAFQEPGGKIVSTVLKIITRYGE